MILFVMMGLAMDPFYETLDEPNVNRFCIVGFICTIDGTDGGK